MTNNLKHICILIRDGGLDSCDLNSVAIFRTGDLLAKNLTWGL